jgi:hypothetical protein
MVSKINYTINKKIIRPGDIQFKNCDIVLEFNFFILISYQVNTNHVNGGRKRMCSNPQSTS